MSFTYTSTNVGSSGLATVRFYTGQTSSGTAVLTDEEIAAVLANLSANHLIASAICAENLAAYYSFQADTRNEGLDIKNSQRSQQYTKLAQILRQRAGGLASVFVGGLSQQTKEDRSNESDLVQPYFKRADMDFPGSVDTSTE